MAIRMELPVEFDEGVDDYTWSELSKLSGLPDEARPRVDEIIAIYRQHRYAAERMKPRQVRDSLTKLADQAKTFREGLEEILHNDDLKEALAGSYNVRRPSKSADARPPKLLAETIKQLDRAASELHAAAKKVPRGKPGSDPWLLQITIGFLNLILQHYTGKRINRSTNYRGDQNTFAFATAVLQLADDTLKVSSVENAIRELREWDEKGFALLRKAIASAKD